MDTAAKPHLRLGAAPKLTALAVGGAVLSGLLASACCLGPAILAGLGLGGAALLGRFDAYRPFFTLATFGLLGVGFFGAYRRRPDAAAAGCACEQPGAKRLGRGLLWIAAVVAVGSWAFPYVAGGILG